MLLFGIAGAPGGIATGDIADLAESILHQDTLCEIASQPDLTEGIYLFLVDADGIFHFRKEHNVYRRAFLIP